MPTRPQMSQRHWAALMAATAAAGFNIGSGIIGFGGLMGFGMDYPAGLTCAPPGLDGMGIFAASPCAAEPGGRSALLAFFASG